MTVHVMLLEQLIYSIEGKEEQKEQEEQEEQEEE